MTVRCTLKELRAPNALDRALGGESALQFLHNPDNPRPGLILLDFNMPCMNGIEFVAEIKKDPELRVIPVVVPIISSEHGNSMAAFDNSLAGFMVKLIDYPQFVSSTSLIHDSWITSAGPP